MSQPSSQHITRSGSAGRSGNGSQRRQEPQRSPEKILQGLNERQREAVTATDGPVLIIAGPGSGKTRTLTHRIAYLIATERAAPAEILALTFTNKAAREMKSRISRLVGPAARHIWMGTFHSTFARLLRVEGEHLGYTRDYSIYDTDDTERILRGLMDRFGIDKKQYQPRAIRSLISSAKNKMVSPAEYERLVSGPTQERAAQLFRPYQEALKRANAMDFDDLLLKPIDLFEQEPDILAKYQERWAYIHIDEYQDTNHAQYVLAKMLARRHSNLCVVGDDAQSIYAFRGADISNILSFQRDYSDATAVRLEQNYRSTKSILRLADAIIKNNEGQLEKELWTDNSDGEPVILTEALSEKDEAKKIEGTIRSLRARGGFSYGSFAVLYRTNAQSRALEEAFRRGGIPYRVIGGLSFYQRREIKDALAYLRLLVNSSDAACLRRVINYPTRGIGAKTQAAVIRYARARDVSLWTAIKEVSQNNELSSRAKNAVGRFHGLIAEHVERLDSEPAEELARSLLKESGLFDDLRKDTTQDHLMRWENVQELLSAIAEYTSGAEHATLSTFLQEVTLLTDQDEAGEEGDQVTLMTLHASKGLEFPVVFVTGMEEGLFPLSMAAQDRDELEEERRLFYVGATRAEKRLFLSYARTRYRYGDQQSCVRSRFFDELEEGLMEKASGGAYEPQRGRFSLESRGEGKRGKGRKGGRRGGGGGRGESYKEADPHGYRRNLRETQKKKRASGRRVVYDEGEGTIAAGVQVEHDSFGEGKVLSTAGQGDRATAVVFFPEVGQKKLKLKFAGLRRID